MAAIAFQKLLPRWLKGWVVGPLLGLGAWGVIAFGPKPDRPVRPATSAAAVSAPAPVAVAVDDALDWANLSATQRAVLRPLQTAWPGLNSINRRRWLEVAQKMRHLLPEARRRAQSRMADWAKMPPEERAQARLQYVYAKRVPAAKRAALWSKYQASPAASAAIRDPGVTMVAPALARVRPGATTVSITQLLRPATVEGEEEVRAPG